MAIAFPLARSRLRRPAEDRRLPLAARSPSSRAQGTGLGQVIANEIAPRRWRAEVELARMPHVDAADIQALIDAIGPSGTFYLHNPAQLGPRDDPRRRGDRRPHGRRSMPSAPTTSRCASPGCRPATGCAAATCCTSTMALEPDPAGAAPHRRGRHRQRRRASPASSRCGRSSRPGPPPGSPSPWSAPPARMMLEPGSFDPGTEGPVNTSGMAFNAIEVR